MSSQRVKSSRNIIAILCSICLVYVFIWKSSLQNKVADTSLEERNTEEPLWSNHPLQTVHIQIKRESKEDFKKISVLENSDYKSSRYPLLSAHLRIVYNRVGKCGSRSMLTLMKELSKKNKFELISTGINNKMELSNQEQKEFVDFLEKKNPPYVFQRHLHYVEFEKFTNWTPIYINMIRDPVDRFVSAYYFSRFGDGRNDQRTWTFGGSDSEKYQTFDECVLRNRRECSENKAFYIIPFFCGHSEMCKIPSRWALERAKKNLLEHFLVVGLTEEFENFLIVLENLLPQPFHGIVDLWKNKDANRQEKVNSTQTLHKKPPTEHVRAIMKKRLQIEYEFYDFVKIHFSFLKHLAGVNQTFT